MKKSIDCIEKGITLIALVITIIILLILAGVTLGNAFGENGLIAKVKKATEKYKESELEEKEQLEELFEKIDSSTGNIVEETKKELLEKLEELEKEESVEYYKLKNGEEVPIPKEFYYVGGTIEEGVVISDDISDKEKYAEVEDAIVPSGAENDAYSTSGKIIKENLKLKGNQFVWIPCSIEEYKKIDFGNDNGTWEKNTNSAELQQIMKYGGFYIGRFEAGTSEITLNSGVTFGSAEKCTSWQSDKYTFNKITSGNITERPRRNTILSFGLSNCNKYVCKNVCG